MVWKPESESPWIRCEDPKSHEGKKEPPVGTPRAALVRNSASVRSDEVSDLAKASCRQSKKSSARAWFIAVAFR